MPEACLTNKHAIKRVAFVSAAVKLSHQQVKSAALTSLPTHCDDIVSVLFWLYMSVCLFSFFSFHLRVREDRKIMVSVYMNNQRSGAAVSMESETIAPPSGHSVHCNFCSFLHKTNFYQIKNIWYHILYFTPELNSLSWTHCFCLILKLQNEFLFLFLNSFSNYFWFSPDRFSSCFFNFLHQVFIQVSAELLI